VSFLRVIISSFTSTIHKIARFSASGRTDEQLLSRESMQHYGFASSPLANCEGVVIREGNHLVMIAEDDRRYRIGLANGEVAIYTDEGDAIHLKRGRTIEITAGSLTAPGHITIKATGDINVLSPLVKIGNETLINAAAGIVTQLCACSVTGAVHPIGSTSVKATP
jgi:phage gp45-like